MRKSILLIVLLASATLLQAQSAGDIFEKYRHESRADYLHLPPIVMSIVKRIVPRDEDLKQVMKRFHSVKVLDLEECSARVKQQFAADVKTINKKGYDELVRTNDGGEKTLVLARGKEGHVREILVITTGPSDCTMVQVKGSVTLKDINKWLESEKRK